MPCVACENGSVPSPEAHACYFCEKGVHVLEGCSWYIGKEEKYGQKRG